MTSLIAFYRKSAILEGMREKKNGAVLHVLAAVTVVDARQRSFILPYTDSFSTREKKRHLSSLLNGIKNGLQGLTERTRFLLRMLVCSDHFVSGMFRYVLTL